MRIVKVGIIGLGEVAQIIHLPILEMLADRFEIAALCDISPALLETMGEKYRVSRLYPNALQLVSQNNLDAVFVLNNDEHHAECVIAALKNKKHVLVEKPMTLNIKDAKAVIQARDEAGVQVMVGYMRRFAPAFVQAVEEVKTMEKILYARVKDIIGQNRLIIEQSSHVHRFMDIPGEAVKERAKKAKEMVFEAIGEVPEPLISAYRLMCGLSSHDISAMREILGVPLRVKSAAQWNGGRNFTAIFEYEQFFASFETGVDLQRRFDAHIEIYAPQKSIKIQYDSPYIRHLPTRLIINETVGDAYSETLIRPNFKDPYTYEIEFFHDVVTKGKKPKTTPEDFIEDLKIFKAIINGLKE